MHPLDWIEKYREIVPGDRYFLKSSYRDTCSKLYLFFFFLLQWQYTRNKRANILIRKNSLQDISYTYEMKGIEGKYRFCFIYIYIYLIQGKFYLNENRHAYIYA